MPESLIFLTENSPGVSNDRFGFNTQNQYRRGLAEPVSEFSERGCGIILGNVVIVQFS